MLKKAKNVLMLAAFLSPQALWSQTYQVRIEHDQIIVDQSFMEAQVRNCIQSADNPEEISDCAGPFSQACMEENLEWGQSTLGMFLCLEAEATVWSDLVSEFADTILQKYQLLDDEDKDLVGSLPLRVLSFADAQQHWVKARDADCLVEYLRWRGGTGAKLLGAACRLDRTSRRAVWLRTLVEEN